MGRKGFERVSQREYARRLGISNEAVRKAIEAKKIVKGWDEKEKKIIVEKANEEWGNIHIQANEEANANQNEALVRIQSYMPNQGKPPGKKNQDPDDTQAATLEELANYEFEKKTSFAEALRVEKVAKAQIAVLDYKEKITELVNKGEVYRKLFAFGQSVRQAMLAVPDRCIDALIAAQSRAVAHKILSEEIHEALQKLATPPEIKPENINANKN